MDIQTAVFEKVAEQKGVDVTTLTRETTFLDIGADSLDMVEFSLDWIRKICYYQNYLKNIFH